MKRATNQGRTAAKGRARSGEGQRTARASGGGQGKSPKRQGEKARSFAATGGGKRSGSNQAAGAKRPTKRAPQRNAAPARGSEQGARARDDGKRGAPERTEGQRGARKPARAGSRSAEAPARRDDPRAQARPNTRAAKPATAAGPGRYGAEDRSPKTGGDRRLTRRPAAEAAPPRARKDSPPAKRGVARPRNVPRDSGVPRALADAPALRRAQRAAPRGTTVANAPDIPKPARVRLQKALAAAGVASRRRAEELIAAGEIKVNGKVVRELGTKVDPDRDAIEVRGSRVQLEKKVYFVLNKPDGVVCSAEGPRDGEGRPTVLSLFPDLSQRIYPVGRLDFHTRGVLIVTNDGDLAAALTHPRHEIPKTYHAKFQGKLTDEALEALASGVILDDGTVTRPAAEVSVIKETATNSWVQITLKQGLNRQIRRMGEAIGHPVLKLIRVAVAGVTADGLADGEFRPLTPTEVYDLMAAATPAAQARRAVGEAAGPGPQQGAPAGGRARSRLAPRRRAG